MQSQSIRPVILCGGNGKRLWPVSRKSMPKQFALLVGPQYAEAADGLMLAAIASVAFTLSFLIATFLAALNNRIGIWVTAAAALIQLILMAVFTEGSSVTFINILEIKCAVQCALALGLSVLTCAILLRRARSSL